MVAYPFLEGHGFGEVVLQILFSATLIFGVLIVTDDKKHGLHAIFLAVPTIASAWATIVFPSYESIRLASYGFSIMFYIYTIRQLLKYIIRIENINSSTIYAAICIYLLMGISWGLVYLIIDNFEPDSFLVHGQMKVLNRTDALYYSYMTLTTTGYGDIVPNSKYTRTTASIESVTGVLYVAVLVSRLVGTYK
jgi:voltage-gated potassium channel Kch